MAFLSETSKKKSWTSGTLQGTNISPWSGMFEDDFPFSKVGYVSFPEGMFLLYKNDGNWRQLDDS